MDIEIDRGRDRVVVRVVECSGRDVDAERMEGLALNGINVKLVEPSRSIVGPAYDIMAPCLFYINGSSCRR